MEILATHDLSKSFGQLDVIHNLNLSVEEHSVFGFIGKNGAGKTTTMKMILGFIKPTAGDIFVCGEKVAYGSTKTNRHIGYLPDVPAFYDYMTPKEYLRLCGKITGLSDTQIAQKTNELLPLVGLDGVNRKIKGFSRGMKQRLGIAQALFNDPKLLICDEPTSALDPVGRKEILDILRDVKAKTTIVFSTHILSDVERICDTIAILDQGTLALEGSLNTIKNSYRKDSLVLELGNTAFMAQIHQKLSALSGIESISTEENTAKIMTANAEATGREIVQLLAKENIPLLKFEILEPTLESVFMKVIG